MSYTDAREGLCTRDRSDRIKGNEFKLNKGDLGLI